MSNPGQEEPHCHDYEWYCSVCMFLFLFLFSWQVHWRNAWFRFKCLCVCMCVCVFVKCVQSSGDKESQCARLGTQSTTQWIAINSSRTHKHARTQIPVQMRRGDIRARPTNRHALGRGQQRSQSARQSKARWEICASKCPTPSHAFASQTFVGWHSCVAHL